MKKAKIIPVLAVFLLVLANLAGAESMSVPKTSKVMQGKKSQFSLEDPRVALEKIKEARNLGTSLAAGDAAATAQVDDLIAAFPENKGRKDGFGFEIQAAIIKSLAELKSAKAVDLLCSVLDDPKAQLEIKIKAVEALGKIGDKRAETALNNYISFLKAKMPKDPMAAGTFDRWIKAAQDALAALK